ncbi:MAG: anti-anti-sigma regulatory factor [Pseudomonadota bacterium]|jgi:anti-anti-sigma factor
MHSVFSPRGRIDSANAAAAESEVLALLERGGPSIILDLSALEYASSAGLRVLLVAAKTARSRGGKALIVAPRPAVLDVLRMSGFDKIIPLVASLEEAASQLA